MNNITQSSELIIYNPNTPNSGELTIYRPREELQIAKIDSRMQNILSRSLKAQWADHYHFHKYGDGDIIVLIGNSTAGKTSIIQALKRKNLNWTEDGHDLRCDAVVLHGFRKHCPGEIALLSQFMDPLAIRPAVYNNIYSWNRPISSLEQKEAETAFQSIRKTMDKLPNEEKDAWFINMQLQMVDEAIAHSRRGGNIIFDVLAIDAFARYLITKKFDAPLSVALVYCPFNELSARIEKRNQQAVESGHLDDLRVGHVPLKQFSELYTQKQPGEKSLETITRIQATQAFCDHFDRGIAADRKAGTLRCSDEQVAKNKASELQHFLDNLGFTEAMDQVDIAPSHQNLYHQVIDSSKNSPEQSADLFAKGTVRYP